jgi:hypothetical protein
MGSAGTSAGIPQNMMISSYFRSHGGTPTTEDALRKSLGVSSDNWGEMTRGSAARGAVQGYLSAMQSGDSGGAYQYLGTLLQGHPDIQTQLFEGSGYNNLGPNITPRARAGMLGVTLPQSLGLGSPTTSDNNVPGGNLQSRGQLEMNRLQRDLNITPAAAAGVAGSLMGEGLTTAGENGGRGPGYGIAQWTSGRKNKFYAWSSKEGLDPTKYETQQQYLGVELKNDFPDVYKQLQNPNITAGEAADVWTRNLERPRDVEGQSAVRQGYAASLMSGYDSNSSSAIAAGNQKSDADTASLNASRYVSDSVNVVVGAFHLLAEATDIAIGAMRRMGSVTPSLGGGGMDNGSAGGPGFNLQYPNQSSVPHDIGANAVPVQ